MYETLKFTEMTTRRVIDAKDKDGEKVYVKGHAKATYMSDGRTVEDAIKQIGTGGGGGGGIAVETDPVFSASPAAGITEEQIVAWNDLDEMVNLLDADVAQLTKDVMGVQESLTDLDTIRSGASKGATAVQPEDIEDVARLDEEYVVANGIVSKEDVYYHLPNTNTSDAAHTLATKDDVSLAVETYIADFTIASLREGIYDGIDVECDIQALVEAMNANKVILVREDEDSSFQGVYVLNGCAEDLLYFSIVDTAGNVLYCDGTDYVYTKSYINGQTLFYRNWFDKQDTLVSGENIKTINGESILGEGNIEISGGSGEVGPQGPQGDKGDKGDKGDTGTGVQSVKQTTISNTDGGSNVVTVTLTNGTTSTFTVKNGSKGSNGTNGTNGKDGADGDDGATFTPSVDSAGNLSWTNDKGLANPPTVNIKGPKGDAGEGGGGSSGGGKVIASVSADRGGISFGARLWPPMSPNTIYVYDSGTILKHLTVYEFEDTSELYAEYSVIFKLEIGSDEDTADVSLPEYVLWANGVIPQVEAGVTYELSITRTKLRGGEVFNAVLTPFKAV